MDVCVRVMSGAQFLGALAHSGRSSFVPSGKLALLIKYASFKRFVE